MKRCDTNDNNKTSRKAKSGRLSASTKSLHDRSSVKRKKVLAHLPNSGKLVTVLTPNATAFLKEQRRVGRESKYDLFAVEHSDVPIIVDTRFSTVAAQNAILQGLLKTLKGYGVARQNVKMNHSLFDLLLKQGAKQFFLEIKCVTHVVDGVAMFPDAPTLRGRKHLKTLMGLVEQGFEAGILFSVQRPDAKTVRPYREMDLLFSQLLKEATRTGVRVFTQTLVFKPPNLVEVKTNLPVFSLD